MVSLRRFTRFSSMALALSLAVTLGTIPSVGATTPQEISIVSASPTSGPGVCRPGYQSPQCLAVPFTNDQNLAFQGNGFAQPAVAKDILSGYVTIHQPQFANDGYYGNGASWISNSADSWVKIDLGRVAEVDRVILGRDRIGGFNDRDPGQFVIAVAMSDDVYANGNDQNDQSEYTQVFDSAAAGFSGEISGTESIQAGFPKVKARFVKLTVANSGAAIDEMEVLGSVDRTPPTTVATVTPGPNENGWNNSAVTVRLMASDELSGVASVTYELAGVQTTLPGDAASLDVVADGETTVTYYAMDAASNVETAHSLTVRVDKTAPTVVYSGNEGTYTVDRQIAITCTAADALSGVAGSTCADISGPAYGFNPGENSYTATAVDKAGNVGSGSTSFTVAVTSDSVCTLVNRFVTQQGVANSLCTKLRAAGAAGQRGDAKAEAGVIRAFINEVEAQVGKTLTPDQAVILKRLASAL